MTNDTSQSAKSVLEVTIRELEQQRALLGSRCVALATIVFERDKKIAELEAENEAVKIVARERESHIDRLRTEAAQERAALDARGEQVNELAQQVREMQRRLEDQAAAEVQETIQ